MIVGVNRGIRKMEAPTPLYFERGGSPNLWDVDSNHYLDFQLGQGAILYGHAPTGLAAVIAVQTRV
jgi:glutamate-1-semialdehyde 2,1-aminomutase